MPFLSFHWKEIKGILLSPKKTLTDLAKGATSSQGFNVVLTGLVIWFFVSELLFLLSGFIAGKNMTNFAMFTLTAMTVIFVATLLGIMIGASIASTATRWFNGKNDKQTTIGLAAYTVIPIMVIGIIASFLDLISTLTGNALVPFFEILTALLFFVSTILVFVVGVYAVQIPNKISWNKAFVSFLIGLLVGCLAAAPVMFIGRMAIDITAILVGVV